MILSYLGIAFIVILGLVGVSFDSWATVTLPVIATFLFVFVKYGAATVLTFLYTNIFTILLGMVVFLIIGAVWSVFRWWRYLIKVKTALDEFKKDNTTANQKEVIKQFLFYNSNLLNCFPPRASKRKSEITMWIMLWPLSMISYIFGELVVTIVEKIVNSLTGIYAKITAKVFEGYNISE